MATYDSYADAIENAPIGSTISAGGSTGGSENFTVDESTSNYDLIGDQEPLGTPAENAALEQNEDNLLREYGMNPNAGDPVTTEDPDPPDLPSPGEQIQDYYDGLESDPVNESQPDPTPPPAPAPDPTPDMDTTTNGPDAGGETNGGNSLSNIATGRGEGGPGLLIVFAAVVFGAIAFQGVMN
jgi:hypothetical protein